MARDLHKNMVKNRFTQLSRKKEKKEGGMKEARKTKVIKKLDGKRERKKEFSRRNAIISKGSITQTGLVGVNWS